MWSLFRIRAGRGRNGHHLLGPCPGIVSTFAADRWGGGETSSANKKTTSPIQGWIGMPDAATPTTQRVFSVRGATNLPEVGAFAYYGADPPVAMLRRAHLHRPGTSRLSLGSVAAPSRLTQLAWLVCPGGVWHVRIRSLSSAHKCKKHPLCQAAPQL